MTKTEATKRARRVLQGGHFDRGASIDQRCPDCREVVSVPKIMGQTKVADLCSALVEHLHLDCEAQS